MSEGIFACGDVELQRGGTLRDAQIVYKTFGRLSPRRDNDRLLRLQRGPG